LLSDKCVLFISFDLERLLIKLFCHQTSDRSIINFWCQ